MSDWYEVRRPRDTAFDSYEQRQLAPASATVERWRPVIGYEGLYEDSNRGQVRSIDRWIRYPNRWGGTTSRFWQGRMLKQSLNGSNYLFVVLCRDGRPTPCDVHKLVLRSFAGPCPDGQEARHGRGGRHDNRWPENLCYGTHLENMNDQVRDGTRPLGSARGHALLTEDIVRICRIRHAAGETQRALAAEFGVSNQSMSKAISGLTWGHA